MTPEMNEAEKTAGMDSNPTMPENETMDQPKEEMPKAVKPEGTEEEKPNEVENQEGGATPNA